MCFRSRGSFWRTLNDTSLSEWVHGRGVRVDMLASLVLVDGNVDAEVVSIAFKCTCEQ